MEGNFQSVDRVSDVLTRDTCVSFLFKTTTAQSAPATSATQMESLKTRCSKLVRLELQHKLTLFFSNFQFSSWVRICSTTDMASRPCLTYSFSWTQRDGSDRREEVLTEPPLHPSNLRRDSSASQALLVQVLLGACRQTFRGGKKHLLSLKLRRPHRNTRGPESSPATDSGGE